MKHVVDDDLDEFFGRTSRSSVGATSARAGNTVAERPVPVARTTAARTAVTERPARNRRARSLRGPEVLRAAVPGAPKTAVGPAKKASSKNRSATNVRSTPLRSVPVGVVSPRPALLDRAGRDETRPPRPSRRPAPRPAATRVARRPRRAAPLDGTASRRRVVRRLVSLMVVVLAVVVAITVRLVTVQISQRDQWVAYGQEQRDGWRELPAGRGAIYDRNGQPLAMSIIQPDVVADPGIVPDKTAAAKLLAPVLDVGVAELEKLLSVEGDYSLLASGISAEVAAEIEQLREAETERVKGTRGHSALTGIVLRDRFVRHNPSGTLAGAVVGRTVADGGVDENGRQGLSGIELQFDAALTGEPGRMTYEHDPSGRTIAGGAETIEPAQPGRDLYLTIDQALQFESERAIGDQVAATGATSGMVLMMRPSTGEILAMSSVAVNGEGDVVNTRDNRPVTAVFEPGSVNKMITVAGALEEGLMAPDTVLEVPDHLTIHDKTFTDHDPHPTSAWSVTDILVTSSNIGTIKMAQALGRERVDAYLRDFGLGETTGLGFPSEENGITLPLEKWSGTSIGAIPIGQGIAVTALQMLMAYNVIANDGVYVAPKLIAGTDDGAGRTEADASQNRRVVSTSTARSLQEMLEKVVSEGTGRRAEVADYPAAGKTGTARIPQGVDATDGYLGTDGRYHYQSTFLGFVTGADLSILVTLQDPQTSTYGGEVAAPVFSELAGIALLRSQTPPPAMIDEFETDVPEVSASAREIGEDAGPSTTAATG